MAPSWISTNKNIHAKDKPAELCAHQPQEETAARRPAASTSDLLRPSPNYRGTSGFSVSLTFLTLFLRKHTFLQRITQWKENRPSIFRPQFGKNLELFFFLIKAPHNLKFLYVLIIQFQNTTLIARGPHGKALSQQDSHRFLQERAARCPPPFFSAWVATRFLNPCTLLSFKGAIPGPFPFPSQQVVKGPMACKLPVARLGQPARGQAIGCGVPAGEITRQDKSLGLPRDLAAGSRLLGKTARV